MEHKPIRGDESPIRLESRRGKEMENIYQQEVAEGASIVKRETNLKSSEGTIIDYLKNTETAALKRMRDLDPDKGANLNVLISYVAESCAETMYDLGDGKPPVLTRLSENLLSSKDIIFDEMQRLSMVNTQIDTINFKETVAEARLEGLRIVHSGDSSALDKVKYLFAQELVQMFLLEDMEVLPQLKLLFSVDEMAAIIKNVNEEVKEMEEKEELMSGDVQDTEDAEADDETHEEKELLTSIGVHGMMAERIASVRKEKEQERLNRAFEASEKFIESEQEYTTALIKKYDDIRDFVDDVLDIGNMPA